MENRGVPLQLKRQFVSLISILAVLGLVSPASGARLSWSDLSPDRSLQGLDLDPSDLREYRPDAMFQYDGATQANPDNEDFPTPTELKASRVFLGGQNPLYGQLSTIRTIQETSTDNTRVCQDLEDPLCFGANQQSVEITANIPACDPQATAATAVEPCILGISESFLGSNNETELSFERYVDNSLSPFFMNEALSSWLGSSQEATGLEYVVNPGWEGSDGIPSGSSAGLWASGTDNFYARATLSIIRHSDGELFFSGLDTQLVRYALVEESVDETGFLSSNFYPPTWITRNSVDAATEAFPLFSGSPMVSFNDAEAAEFISCAFEELDAGVPVFEELQLKNLGDPVSRCGIALRHLPNTRYQMQLLIPEQLGGWFQGRLANANLTLDTSVNSLGLNLLTISGEPVTVPTTSMQFTLCDDTEPNASFQDYLYLNDANLAQSQCERPIGERGLGDYGHWSPDGDRAISDFTTYEQIIDERAKGWVNMWAFSTLAQSETYGGRFGQCLADAEGLQGMISTNAMVYKAGIPELVAGGALAYQVASTSLDVDGIPILGDYTLVMRSDLAQCIYGLGSEPIAGSLTEIKVTGEDGSPRPAITAFEDVDGWLSFKARGFGFSAPTIAVSINRPVVVPRVSAITESRPKQLLAPRLSAVPVVGSTLSVSNGVWLQEDGLSFAYQWYRCEKGFSATRKTPLRSAGCQQIAGAASPSYTPVGRDARYLLSAKVTATNTAGSASARTASAPFDVKRLLDYSIAPAITGLSEAGQTVRARTGSWSLRNIKTSVLWFSCERPTAFSELGKIAGCDSTAIVGKRFTAKKSDVGSNLVARVTVRKGKQVFVYFTLSVPIYAEGEFRTQ